MNARQLTASAPGQGPAFLTLPQPTTLEALWSLEEALAATLGTLRHDLRGAADPGAVEYASWMQLPHPGAVEYASWMRQLHPSQS